MDYKKFLGAASSVALLALIAGCSQPAPAPAASEAASEAVEAASDAASAASDAASAASDAASAASDAASEAAAAPAAAGGAVVLAAADGTSFTGDATAGARVFRQCATCHVLAEGQNKVGPSMYKIIGRTAGSVEGFKYSAANKASGIVWTEQAMFDYLEDPKKTIPGTIMAFAGLKKPQDRADVIAYIAANGGR